MFPLDKTRTLFCFNHKRYKEYGHADARHRYNNKFTDNLRFKIFDRDDHVCQLCGRQSTDRTNKGADDSIQLDAHHINYDKYDCRECNLISLCHSCHSMTNSKRGAWIQFFCFELPSIDKQSLYAHVKKIKGLEQLSVEQLTLVKNSEEKGRGR